MTSRLTGAHILGLLVCAALFLGGGALVLQALQGAPPDPTPTPDREFSISPEEASQLDRLEADRAPELPAEDLGPHVNTEPVELPAGAPPAHHLYIPSLYVSAPVVSHGVTSANVMSLPTDLGKVGLLDVTSPLDSDEGSTLIAGHVTYRGEHGVLYLLGKIRPGAGITTVDAQQRATTWVVTSVSSHRQTSLPDEIFSVTGPRTLTLVTCGGDIIETADGTWTYEDNIVVTAVPLL